MDRQSAILVDGDNISAAYADPILRLCAHPDQATVIRVYGDASKPSGWLNAHDFRFIHSGMGKNATDILMAIDAIELAHSGRFSAFVLVSSDGDFTHLAVRLREAGIHVTGAGEAKAPEAFRAACTRFELLVRTASPEIKPIATSGGPTEMDRNIRSIISANSKNGEGMRITDLNPIMRVKFDTKISEKPEGNWRNYLTARPGLYDLDPKGPDAKVRFKPPGFS
jgi:NYN domain